MTAAPAGEVKAAEPNNPFEIDEDVAAAAETATPEPKRPADSASKGDWQAYAKALGLSDEGTKNDIVARVDGTDEGTKGTDEPGAEVEGITEIVETGAVPDYSKEILHKLDTADTPIAANSGDIQGLVKVRHGIRLLELSIAGWIGDAPVTILAEQASDVERVISELRKQAEAKLSER